MSASNQQTVPVTLTTRVDVSRLVEWRRELLVAEADVAPTFTDIAVKAVAVALSECPSLNACWQDDGVLQYDQINIAIAVDTDAGLLAPIIRDADKLSLDGIATESKRLVSAARAGTLSDAELVGGTFTVTNLGMFGIDEFTPVINQSQSGILGIGRILETPVVRDGHVVVGNEMTLSLTFDHRVLDGAPAARWLQTFAKLLQEWDD